MEPTNLPPLGEGEWVRVERTREDTEMATGLWLPLSGGTAYLIVLTYQSSSAQSLPLAAVAAWGALGIVLAFVLHQGLHALGLLLSGAAPRLGYTLGSVPSPAVWSPSARARRAQTIALSAPLVSPLLVPLALVLPPPAAIVLLAAAGGSVLGTLPDFARLYAVGRLQWAIDLAESYSPGKVDLFVWLPKGQEIERLETKQMRRHKRGEPREGSGDQR